MNVWIEAFLLFLPAGIANMTPPLANKIPVLNTWNTPMDFGKLFHGKPIFGSNKTWRGFISAVIIGTAVGALLYEPFFADTDWKTYLLRCLAISAGAIAGDAIKSFAKRRVGVSPGSSWFPFDQIDYVAAGLICLIPFGLPSLPVIGAIVVIYFIGTMLATYIGYLIGVRNAPI